MTRRTKHILATLTVTTLFAVVAGAASSRDRQGTRNSRTTGWADKSGHERQERCRNGDYSAKFAGFYRGTGTAVVGDNLVRLRAVLTDKSGKAGLLQADLETDGPYFSGVGTIHGEPVAIRGRVDAARMSRVSATYYVTGGHGGRLIAELPAGQDSPDEQWDQVIGRAPGPTPTPVGTTPPPPASSTSRPVSVVQP